VQEDLIRQLDEAVTEVFAVMLNLACTSEPVPVQTTHEYHPSSDPTTPQSGEPDRDGCFTASVLFSGPLQGRCCIQMEGRTATELTSNMMGMAPCEISPDLCADTAGELCNMIAGCWKKRHPKDLAASHLSCPIVNLGCCSNDAATFREDVTVLYRFDGHHLTLRLAFN